jgi:hypothetical protein
LILKAQIPHLELWKVHPYLPSSVTRVGFLVSQQAFILLLRANVCPKALARVDSELSSAEEELSIRELRRDTRYSVMSPTTGGKMNKVTLSIKETGKASGITMLSPILSHQCLYLSSFFIINNGFKEDSEDSYGDPQSSLPNTSSFTKRNSTANDALKWVQAVALQAYLQPIFVAVLYLR